MHIISNIFVSALAALMTLSVWAEDPVVMEKSWNGGAFSYPEGEPQITAIHSVLDGTQTVAFHCHPVPVFAYILKGILEVETAAGDSRQFAAGESLVEVMSTSHRGTVIEAPVEMIIFYAGAKDVPNRVLADSDEAAQYCLN